MSDAIRGRPFRYYRDPVPVICWIAYLLYRFWIKHTFVGHVPFFHDHFNDVLCLPIFLPPVLWVQREIGLRRHDGPPTPFEVLFHLVVWSICFEGIAPLLTSIYRTTADVGDVAAYAIGGLSAGLVWGTWRWGVSIYDWRFVFPVFPPVYSSHAAEF